KRCYKTITRNKYLPTGKDSCSNNRYNDKLGVIIIIACACIPLLTLKCCEHSY
uniref:Uncharacterized protein n=1 Tax=Gouania willdenowi TaxID=441366 RepID=A0A8C5GXE4_GOUWI